MAKHLLVIICTSAGQQNQISQDVAELLNTHNVSHKILTIKIPPDLPKVIKKLTLTDYDAIAVYGGDGTMVAAIKALQPHAIPLILLPGGTANVISKYVGMPTDPLEGLTMYTKDTYIRDYMDLAYVNDEPLVLDMHMGLWTEALTNTSRKLKKRIGRAAYAWSTFREARRTTKQNYIFALDGKPAQKTQGYTFLVANQGDYKVLGLSLFKYRHAPGMVQLAIFKRVRPYMLVAWFVYKLVTGRNLHSVISTYQARRIRILKAPNQALADDAERRLTVPLEVVGSSKGVRVLVPPSIAQTSRIQVWRHQFDMWRLRTWHRFKVFTGQPPELRYSHVASGIYLGGKVTPRMFQRFREWGITGVVSMRNTEPPQTPEDIETLWLATKDWTPPTIESFEKGVNFIRQKLDANGAVYIHCQLGEGRGPSMAAAYLISQGFTVDEAITRLIKYRPMVQPNAAQRKRLAEWQEYFSKKVS